MDDYVMGCPRVVNTAAASSGKEGEQNVFQFYLSKNMALYLELHDLALALRQTQFQLEFFIRDS
ncbi:hypothetical protein DN31_1789 [Vibrio mimicus]|nr:hypothetical protein DN31_1789 [Vibrio mimicus]